jgi:hemolysin activation/secretion protein
MFWKISPLWLGIAVSPWLLTGIMVPVAKAEDPIEISPNHSSSSPVLDSTTPQPPKVLPPEVLPVLPESSRAMPFFSQPTVTLQAMALQVPPTPLLDAPPVIAPTPAQPPTQPPAPAPLPPQTPAPNPLKIAVQNIQINGSSIFSAAQLTAMVQPFVGRSLDLSELRAIADGITQAYLNLGYLTSRAVLTEQTITNGIVQIQVIEGSLERIDVIGTKRVAQNYIRQRIQLGSKSPLNQQKLEDQLRLLKFDPLFDHVEASLKEGSGIGQSVLTVRVAEAPKMFGNINIDNDSVPSVGGERIGILAGYRNLIGQGDSLYGSYNRSFTGGANLWDFGYQIPLNAMQGSLQLRVAPSSYHITQKEFKDLGISGSSVLYDVSFRQPLSRSPRQELALSLGATYRTGKTLISDVLIDQSTTTVLRLGQDWLNRDPHGVWSLRSQLNLGTGLLGATVDRDPDGRFFSWTGQAERLQLLNADNTLTLQTNWQLTPHALLPSQQFVIGGRQSVRGFRQNQRSGDNGVSLSIEDQITLHRNVAGEAVLQFAPFVDAGWVWNDPQNPIGLPPNNFLAGIGVGLNWKPTSQLNLRLDYGVPLVSLPERGTNLQDAAFYFSLNYRL